MAISTFPSFTGAAKETTYGSPVTATRFTPSTGVSSEDVKNYVADTGMRGSAVTNYNQIPTQGWGTFSYDFPVYLDTVAVPLLGVLGNDAVTGASDPYTHVLTTLNTGTYQPPSFTLVDYNGYEARQFAGSMFSQLAFTLSASGLLTASAQATSLASSVVTKPTQSFSAEPALAGYKGTISVGGASTTLVESATLTIARAVNPILTINNSTSPSQIFSGGITVTGQLTAIFNDDTYLTPMLNGTSTVIDITYANAAHSLDLHMTNCLFTKAPITRGGNGWMEITVDFEAVGNTTDGSTGYSPLKATLLNALSAI